MSWHVGCSGFHYKEWKGSFYPQGVPVRRWFEYYCSRFNTLELNVTFYRFPQLKTLQGWYERSSPHFLFAVKAPRLITHYKQFIATEEMLSGFYATIRDGLRQKLGAVLFQLPAQFIFTEERLERIMQSLDPAYPNVIEFRHQSWWIEEVFTALASKGISFSGVSYPCLPEIPVLNNPLVYYRFHGIPDLYRSSYNTKDMAVVADNIRKFPQKKEAFIFFNNTASEAALYNANTFKHILMGKEFSK